MTDDESREGEPPSDEPSTPQKRDYDVGYGKPPKRTQFAPGKSGNPRGRTAGSKGLRSELRSELSELVTITKDGKSRRVPKRRLVLKALVSKAAKGDVRAADKLISLIIQMEGFEDQRTGRTSLSDNDMQILNLLLAADSTSGGASDESVPVGEAPDAESDQQATPGDQA